MGGDPVLRLAGRIVYWIVVVAISVALLVALVMFFESRDESNVEGASIVFSVA